MNAGTDLARDIQTGFFSRPPLPRPWWRDAAGTLAGIVVLGWSGGVLHATGLLLGVHFAAGLLDALLLVYAALVALGLAPRSYSRCAPARARRSRRSFPAVFLFISS
jgi:hypothetical protein